MSLNIRENKNNSELFIDNSFKLAPLTLDMNVNRLSFVFWTPAGICATVLHTN